LATLDIKAVPGVTEGVAKDTLVAPYNDISAVEELFSAFENEIAAIIVEPVAGNMGCVLPKPGFLEGLRKLCNEQQAVLIFDEVMTGFRLSAGGAQQIFNVEADLVTYGKVIGGGMPVGAFAGKKQIMEHIAPLGNVYQAGTLSGNPIAMIAGYTMLTELKSNPGIYNELEAKTAYLRDGLDTILRSRGKPYQINQFGSMISVHFSEDPVTDYESASKANNEQFKKFFHAMLGRGIYLPPSAFESWFLNNAISANDLDYTLQAAKESLAEIA
jgi:glutamate-1-semialdehyde 2,1-aminomutase